MGKKPPTSQKPAGPKSAQRGRGVLSDHKKVGKKLLPPILQISGGITPTHFARDTMPELLWLALIEWKFGLKESVNLCEKIGNYFQGLKLDKRFVTITDFEQLDSSEWQMIRVYLDSIGILVILTAAVHDLVVLYPNCAFKGLFEKPPERLNDFDFKKNFSDLLEELFEKRGRRSVLMQANAVYLLGCQGKLHIARGLSLGNLDELRNYPDTDESKEVGASVCAASGMLIMMGRDDKDRTSWARYFWKRNLEIEPVSFGYMKVPNGI